MTSHVSVEEVRTARAVIAGGVLHTPSAVSATLSSMTGASVVLKFENLQFTASFKERGALSFLSALAPGTPGVIAMSAGNHAQGVAYHARRLGIPATIVMPDFTPAVKVNRTRVLGARVILHGSDIASCFVEATRIAEADGLTFVHPFDDRRVIAGQGTVALELLEDHPEIEALLVPVGGGGLITGVAAAAPGRAVVGVRSERSGKGTTIAEGIDVASYGALTGPVVSSLEMLTVTEAAIERAIGLLIEVEKTVVEGAGAVGLAALLSAPERFAGRTVGVVLTGGNIDPRLLASVLLRGLVRSGQLVTFRISVDDRPGSLAHLLAIVAAEGGNVVDVRHSRMLTDLSIKAAVVDLVLELASPEQGDAIRAAVEAAGFIVSIGGTDGP